MTELFPNSEMSSLSPRQRWLKEHNLALGELPDGKRFCAGEDRITHGITHKDCELLMARELEVEHWEVTEFKKAGVVIPGECEEEMA